LAGKELVIVKLKPPQVFGEMGYIGKYQYQCTVLLFVDLLGRTARLLLDQADGDRVQNTTLQEIA
jgi:hypothetical protein